MQRRYDIRKVTNAASGCQKASGLARREPVSMAFILEAFVMVGFGAWMIHMLELERPGWLWFVVLSLLGGLAFSAPIFLLMHLRKRSRMQRDSTVGATITEAIRMPSHHSHNKTNDKRRQPHGNAE